MFVVFDDEKAKKKNEVNENSVPHYHRHLFLWAILQQGVRFDPDMPQTIRLEFAKSNTKVSKPKQQAANAANTHPTLMHPLTGRKYTNCLKNCIFFLLRQSLQPYRTPLLPASPLREKAPLVRFSLPVDDS